MVGLEKSKAPWRWPSWPKEKKFTGVILPADNAREAAVVQGVDVIPVANLSQAVAFLNEQLPLEPYELDGEAYTASALASDLDFADVRGQESVKARRHDRCRGGITIS